MTKYVVKVLFLTLLISAKCSIAGSLILRSNHDFSISGFKLSDNDLLWLAKKKRISVGVYGPQTPPILFVNESDELTGVLAEYIALLRNTLEKDVSVKYYNDFKDANTALKSGDIDLIANSFEMDSNNSNNIVVTKPYLFTNPTQVTTQENSMHSMNYKAKIKIAKAKGYPSNVFIKNKYVNAQIISFDNSEQALSSVANGDTDVFIGDNLETEYILSKDYYHKLIQNKTWSQNNRTLTFSINKENDRLVNITNNFIDSLSTKIHNQIISSWVDSKNITIFDGPLHLTRQEKAWIQKHNSLKVIVNPYNLPFSMTDSDGNLRGIAGDLLDLISIKTGLNFTPVYAYSNGKTKSVFESNAWDLHPSVTYSSEREGKITFSKAYLLTPFVIVFKDKSSSLQDLNKHMTVAIPAHHTMLHFIKKNYKQIKIIETDNSTVAINMLNEGSVDAAVSTKLTADYYTTHFNTDDLHYSLIPSAPSAAIAFAMPNGFTILKSIIDKVIDDIPESQILRLSNKWTRMENVNVNTWDLYKTEFYIVIVFSVILIVSSLIWGGYFLRETKRRKISEMVLKDQLNFSSTLSSSVPYPIYIISRDGRLIKSNPAFNAFFSGNEYYEKSKHLSQENHPLHNIYNSIESLKDSIELSSDVVSTTTKISNGKELRDINHWFTAFNKDQDNIPLFICGWSDITDHCMLMDAIRRETETALVEKQAKGEFLARMSHELRTPVSAIMGFLELLRLQYSGDENIELAFTTGENLLGLIGEVLDLEKIESGGFELVEECFNINELLLSIIGMFNALSVQKGLSITLNSSISLETFLRSDPQAIRQVLSNLISNALKFTDHGSVSLSAKIHQKSGQDSQLILSVTDSGVGIPENEREKLFKLFSQTSSGKKSTGSGLGLFICHQIVGIMGGNIFLSESSSHGSTFTVELPLNLSDHKSSMPLRASPIFEQPKRYDLKILIADDNPVNRLLLKKQLASLGYHADDVSNGQEVLNVLGHKIYNLLITDINMPFLDGIELTKHIRKSNDQLIIWGLTANVRNGDSDLILDSGMQLLLFKPLNISSLAVLLQTITVDNEISKLEKIIDMDNLHSLSMGSTELIDKMLDHGRNECKKHIIEFDIIQKCFDIAKIEKITHRIAGTAQILGASKIIHLCECVEKSLAGRISESVIQKEISQLMKELNILLFAINDFLNRDA